ncbi:MAG: DUF1566 domain-containing protein [Arcobacter sp.]|uniref:Lcl C-terminal domain-containing protein n=1 Tax=Arcobacter sp. TaxID=1872629 RepID=UPI003B00BC94
MKVLFTLICFGLIMYLNAEIIKQSEFTVKDTRTNILWQDTKEVNSIKRDFNEAKTYCEALKLDGYNDWKMPSFMELFSIVNTKSYNPTLSKEFKYFKSENYWTSKKFSHGASGEAFVVNFLSGAFNRESMDNKFYVRCFRNEK